MTDISHRIDGTEERWVTFVTGIANGYSMGDRQIPAPAGGFRLLRADRVIE